MQTQEISDEALETLTIIERVTSVLSLVGCIFIITTFCTLKSFHKPINRLVFYASMYGPISPISSISPIPQIFRCCRACRVVSHSTWTLLAWTDVTETAADLLSRTQRKHDDKRSHFNGEDLRWNAFLTGMSVAGLLDPDVSHLSDRQALISH